MKLKCFFFELAFKSAYKSMNLGSQFPLSSVPKFYAFEDYDSKIIRDLKLNHIVVDKESFTYWEVEIERDGRPYWSSWITTNIDEFILRFHKDKIYGEYAIYSLIITQAIYGQYMEFAKQGKTHEYEEKKKKVQMMLSLFLENHLKSYKHMVFKILLKLSN